MNTKEIKPRSLARLFGKSQLRTAGTALGGMIAGALVGIGVQLGVDSTGLLGPSVEALLAQQESNFEDVHQKLETIRQAATDPQVRQELRQLDDLLGRQRELNGRAQAEIRYLGQQVVELKKQRLAESKVVGGADFWLKNGESVNVAGKGQVLALVSARSNIADVNLNGARTRMLVGDALPVISGNTQCTIFFKQAKPRSDGRVGFDIDCS